MNYLFLSKTYLFQDILEDEISSMLSCLNAFHKSYKKGQYIYRVGEQIHNIGLVLTGSVLIENDDIWGTKSILSFVEPGQIFAETYACAPKEPMMVNVIANENVDILFLNVHHLLTTCSSACIHHSKLIQNLLQVTAQKNLELSRRIFNTSSRSIRSRLLSYLSQQSLVHNSIEFTIPFNRQQLADYLNVERSALSKELSKMKAEELIDFSKNQFVLYVNL